MSKNKFITIKKILATKESSTFLCIVFSLFVGLHILLSLYNIITTTAPDFPSYYYATKDALLGINPYTDSSIPNLYIYPILTSLFFLPMLFFSYPVAQAIFVLLSAVIIPYTVWLSLRLLSEKVDIRYLLFFSSLAFLSFPAKFTLGMGQVNLLAYAVLMLAYVMYCKQYKSLSGILFALAFLAKPILSFMLLFLIIKRSWHTLFVVFASLSLAVLISITFYGIEFEQYYFKEVVPVLLHGESGRDVYFNQGLLGFFTRLSDHVMMNKIALFISLFLTLFSSFFFFIKESKHTLPSHLLFSFYITLLVVVHTLSWQHYFVFLIFPLILLSIVYLDRKKVKSILLLILSYLLISINIKDPSAFATFPHALLLSHTLYGGMILLVLLSYELLFYKSKGFRSK